MSLSTKKAFPRPLLHPDTHKETHTHKGTAVAYPVQWSWKQLCECEPKGLQMIPVFQLVKHSAENVYLNEKAGCLKKQKMGISQPNKYTLCSMPIFTAHFVMSFSQLLSNLLIVAQLKFYSLRACVSGWSCAN